MQSSQEPLTDSMWEYIKNIVDNGRKRHIAVDKQELPLAIHVSAANCHDSSQGVELLWQLEKYKRVELCCVDHAYHGTFEDCIKLYEWEI